MKSGGATPQPKTQAANMRSQLRPRFGKRHCCAAFEKGANFFSKPISFTSANRAALPGIPVSCGIRPGEIPS
jgi:hypothetical protein